MDAIPALRRWWWMLAVGALAAGVIANVVASRMQPTYVAQARLLVGPINGDKDTLLASGQLARTYGELATSRPVLESVITSSGAPTSVRRLAEDVKTTSNDVNRIVTVSVEDPAPATAAALANAIATRLREISTATSSKDAAALAGLIAGAIALYLRAAGTGRAADGERVALPPGLPDLGLVDVPGISSPRTLVVDSRPRSAAAEGYRVLVAKLGLLQQDPAASAIVVVGTEEGWPSAVVAANIAAVLAEARRSVLVIDAGAERASVSGLHRLQRVPGYSELLEQGQGLDGDIDEFATALAPRLRILPQGERPVGLLSEEAARAMLARARRTADLVVIAASPIQRSSAALTWGPVVDG